MRSFFTEKGSRFGSLIGLIAVTAMLAIFLPAFPGFLASFYGRCFAVIWAIVAILAFTAHARCVVSKRGRRLAMLAQVEEDRFRERSRKTGRILRG